jgi:hypothetical protein
LTGPGSCELKTGRKRKKRNISGIDALVVAIAEALSYTSAVTIVTTDLEDIGDLVTATGRSNIAVRLPG